MSQDLVIPIQLAAGLDAGTEPKIVQRGLLRLENGVFNRKGALSKRHGLTNLLTGLTTSRHLAQLNGVPVFLGDELKLYNSGSSSWEKVADLHLWDLQEEHKATSGYGGWRCVAVELGDIIFIASTSYDLSGATWWTHEGRTYSKTTGRLIDHQELLNSNDGPLSCHAFVVDGGIVYYTLPDGGDLYQGFVSASGAISTATVLHSFASGLSSTNPYMDACVIGGDDDTVMLAYVDAVQDIRIAMITAAGAVTEVVHATTTANKLGCVQMRDGVGAILYHELGDDSVRVVAYADDGSIEVSEAVLEDLATHTWAAFDVWNLTAIATTAGAGLTLTCYWTEATAASLPVAGGHDWRIRKNVYTDTGGTGSANTPSTFVEGVVLRAHAFEDTAGKHYLPVVPDIELGLAPTSALLLNSSAVPVASYLAGYSYLPYVPMGSTSTAYGVELTRVIERAGDVWCLADFNYGRWMGDSQAPEDPNAGTGISLITLTKGLAGCHALELPDQLLIPGALPEEFTGAQVVEQGFLQYPHKPSAALSAYASADALAIGTYGYRWVIEWFDDRGRRHLSQPSPAVSVTTSATHRKVNIRAPGLTITRKTGHRLVCYRTEANQDVYYRLWSTEGDMAGTHLDATPDASITTEEQLYTGGDALENVSPPPYRVSCLHQNRVFVVPITAERESVWYSKPLRTSMGVEFAGELLSHGLNAGGPITGLQSFFGRLLVFSASEVHVIDGDGLNNAGGGAGYSDYQLANGSGCSDQRLIVEVPSGLIYLNRTGLEALDRQLQAVPIGEPVKYHTDTLSLVRAVSQPSRDAAIFVTSNGLALEINHRYGLWSTRTGHQAVDAAVIGGSLYLLTSTGTVLKENTGWADNGTTVRLLLETGHLSLAEFGRRGRVKKILLFGYNLGEHTLNMAFQYNGDPTWLHAQTFKASDVPLSTFNFSDYYGAGLASSYADQAFVVQATPGYQRNVTSLRIRVYDSAATSTHGGCTIIGMACVVSIGEGPVQPGASRAASAT